MTEKRMIELIQELRDKHTGSSWSEFKKIINNACPQSHLDKYGEPDSMFSRVARMYISELRRAQEFTQGK